MKPKREIIAIIFTGGTLAMLGVILWLTSGHSQQLEVAKSEPAGSPIWPPADQQDRAIEGLYPFDQSCLAWTDKELMMVSETGEAILLATAGAARQMQQAWYQDGVSYTIETNDDPKEIRLAGGDREVVLELPGAPRASSHLFKVSYSPRCDVGVVLDGPAHQVLAFSFLSGFEPTVLREKAYPGLSFQVSPDCSSAAWSALGSGAVQPRPPATVTVAQLGEEATISETLAEFEFAFAVYSTEGKHLLFWGYNASPDQRKTEGCQITIADAQASPLRTVEFESAIGVAQYVDHLDLLVTARPGSIELVAADGRRLRIPERGPIQQIALAPDAGRVWYATRQGGVQSARIDPAFIQPAAPAPTRGGTPIGLQPEHRINANGGAIHLIAASPEHVLTIGSDDFARVWKFPGYTEAFHIPSSADGAACAYDAASRSMIWIDPTGAWIQPPGPRLAVLQLQPVVYGTNERLEITGNIRASDVDASSRTSIVATDESIVRVDTNTKALWPLAGADPTIRGVYLVPGGAAFAVSREEDGKWNIALYSSGDGSLIRTFTDLNDRVNDVAFNHAGTIMFSSSGWDLKHESGENSALPANQVPARDWSVRVWSVDSGTETGRIEFSNPPEWLSVSPEGRFLAVTVEDSIHLIDIDTLSTAAILTGGAEDLTSVAYSPSGYRVYAGSLGGQLLVWNTDFGHRQGAKQ